MNNVFKMIYVNYLMIVEGEEPGLNRDEMDASVATLKSMEIELEAVVKELREKQIGTIDNSLQSKNTVRYVKEFLIRKQSDVEDFTEVRVAVVGNVDAGKEFFCKKFFLFFF